MFHEINNETQPRYIYAVLIAKKEKQPISIYSHIYSKKNVGSTSMNDETIKTLHTYGYTKWQME